MTALAYHIEVKIGTAKGNNTGAATGMRSLARNRRDGNYGTQQIWRVRQLRSSASARADERASSAIAIEYGGTGTSTRPMDNKLLFSDASGNWEYVSTSSLGISGGGGGTFTAIGPNGQTQTGPTVTLATSTNSVKGRLSWRPFCRRDWAQFDRTNLPAV